MLSQKDGGVLFSLKLPYRTHINFTHQIFRHSGIVFVRVTKGRQVEL